MKITYNNSDDLCRYFEIDREKIKFKEPFLLDALLALATKKIIFDEIDFQKINTFKIDEHKVEEFFDKKNRLWIDDSKATNIDATIKALSSYQNKKIHLILGGDDKGANLKPLFEYIKDFDIEIYAIGTNCERILEFCNQFNIKSNKCEVLNVAVEKMAIKHDKNSIAMLSPAAASLDQFSSYKERGKKFKENIFNLSLN